MASVIEAVKNVTLGTEDGPLFEPLKVGDYQLSARYVHAPLTRCRALGNIPQPAAKKYYSERARKGALMLTEATPISQQGQGYPCVPGIHSTEQTQAWKPIVEAVHEKGGVFFMQLWHVGRVSHNDYQIDGADPVAPSAVAIKGQVFAQKLGRMVDYPVPQALDVAGIKNVVQDAVKGARNAMDAGFDGVELHFANGYLFDQFLKTSSNKRTDEYGGSIENRCRFALETVEAVVREVGSGKVGLRLSPYSWEFNECYELDGVDATIALNVYLLKELNKFNLAYVHIVSARIAGGSDAENPDLEKQNLKPFRAAFKGPIIAAGGYLRDTGEAELNEGTADLICFGRWYLANPDFPERLRDNKPFNKYNRDTFYTQDQVVGYTDYKFLEDVSIDTPTEKHYTGQLVFTPSSQKSTVGHEP